MKQLFFGAIIQHHIKTARHCHYYLKGVFKGMATAHTAAWHIVYPVNALYIKRYFLKLFQNRQVTPGIKNFWKVNKPYATILRVQLFYI